MSNELKPCPFCGGEAYAFVIDDEPNKIRPTIMCNNDDCAVDDVYFMSRGIKVDGYVRTEKGTPDYIDWAPLVKAWNTRKSE